MDYDDFGDSYTEDTTPEQLKNVFDRMTEVQLFLICYSQICFVRLDILIFKKIKCFIYYYMYVYTVNIICTFLYCFLGFILYFPLHNVHAVQNLIFLLKRNNIL